MTKTDLIWDEIYHRYMTSRLTYRQLADQYGVSFSVLCRKGAREHWPHQRRQALRDCVSRYAPRRQHEAITAQEENPASQSADFEDGWPVPDPKRARGLTGKGNRPEEVSIPKTRQGQAVSVRQCKKSENLSQTWAKQSERGGRQTDSSEVDWGRQEFPAEIDPERQEFPAETDPERQEFPAEIDRERQTCPIESDFTRKNGLSETGFARRGGAEKDSPVPQSLPRKADLVRKTAPQNPKSKEDKRRQNGSSEKNSTQGDGSGKTVIRPLRKNPDSLPLCGTSAGDGNDSATSTDAERGGLIPNIADSAPSLNAAGDMPLLNHEEFMQNSTVRKRGPFLDTREDAPFSDPARAVCCLDDETSAPHPYSEETDPPLNDKKNMPSMHGRKGAPSSAHRQNALFRSADERGPFMDSETAGGFSNAEKSGQTLNSTAAEKVSRDPGGEPFLKPGESGPYTDSETSGEYSNAEKSGQTLNPTAAEKVSRNPGGEPFLKPGEFMDSETAGEYSNAEKSEQTLNPTAAEKLSKNEGVEPFSKPGESRAYTDSETAGGFSNAEKSGQTLNPTAAEKVSRNPGGEPLLKTGESGPFVPVGQTEPMKVFSEQTLSGLRDLLVQQVHTAFLQLGRRAITEKIHVGVVREPAAPGRSSNSRRKTDEASAAFSDAAEQAVRQGDLLGLEEPAAENAKWKCTYTKDTENIRYVPDDIDVARLKQLSAILRDLYALSEPEDGQKIEVIFAPDTEAWSE